MTSSSVESVIVNEFESDLQTEAQNIRHNVIKSVVDYYGVKSLTPKTLEFIEGVPGVDIPRLGPKFESGQTRTPGTRLGDRR